MFSSPVSHGGPPGSASQLQQQQQAFAQHDQPSQQSESLEPHLQQQLQMQQAQLEAMRILQHQTVPSIVATKSEDIDALQNPPSGPWSTEDYDSMMRSILEASFTSDHFSDLDAPASLASFSASYAGSYMSGSSDSGASPNSINDLVYGATNLPTPSDSDMSFAARNLSFSLASHNGTAFSPDAANTSYPQSYSGSDSTSPFAPNFNMKAPSATSPFGLQIVLLPATSNATSPISASQMAELVTSAGQQWNPNFLAPTAAGMASNADGLPASQPSSAHDASVTSRKRRVGETDAAENVTIKSPPKKALALKSESADSSRKTKKAKSTVPASEPKASAPTPIHPISSKLPHMEVGSNATALAAIARLKAKRLQESQAAAAANASASPQGSSQTSATTTATDKPQLDPATRQQKKVAHNAIERRYRNNINDRIAALRRAVPALREIRPRKTASGRRSRKAQQEEDLVDGVPAATKLNKATILGKATDYIKYLKSREVRLTSEVAGLRELVRSLEGGEELLELWETEMDKVVAEQEAIAAAAAAREEEEAEDDAIGSGNADDDDDDEDDDEEEAETSYASASSSSPPALSRTGSKAGRGRKSGIGGTLSSVASSRYMLATFLGVTFIGSGAEFALDSAASDASQAVGRPGAGRTVVGASRQMLKRSAMYVAPSTSIAQEPHKFDAVPTHALAFEIVRIVSFAACFFFLVWPLFSRLFSHRRSDDIVEETSSDAVRNAESRKLRLALRKGEIDVATFDTSVRSLVEAPVSAVLATPSVVAATSRLALRHTTRLGGLLPAKQLSNEEAAALGRLLEVETLCEGKAQPSALLRLHTALRLANSELACQGRAAVSRDPVLAAPRLKATLALSFARLGEGVDSIQDFADRYWSEARCAVRGERASEGTSASASDRDEGLVEAEDASWLSMVLSLDFDTALDYLGTGCSSTDPKDCEFSAVLSIADVHYCARLTDVWKRLLGSLVRASCPGSDSSATLVKDFVRLQGKAQLNLDVVLEANKRKALHSEITSLARTAPLTRRAWQMAQLTLATWSAVLGNLALARHVASMVHEHPFAAQGNVRLSSLGTLYSLVGADGHGDGAECMATRPMDELDAMADLFLSWLRFLRWFGGARSDVRQLHTATLKIRKLVAAAAVTTTSGVVADQDVEACLDHLTDLCTALGRSMNRIGAQQGCIPKLLVEVGEDGDSGVEVEV